MSRQPSLGGTLRAVTKCSVVSIRLLKLENLTDGSVFRNLLSTCRHIFRFSTTASEMQAYPANYRLLLSRFATSITRAGSQEYTKLQQLLVTSAGAINSLHADLYSYLASYLAFGFSTQSL